MMRGESPTRSRFARRALSAADGMKKLMQVPFALATMERRWLSPLVASTVVSIVLLLVATLSLGAHSHRPLISRGHLVAQNVQEIIDEGPMAGLPRPPRLAYLISGTWGNGAQMQRLVRALYHPLNYYLLHLDLEAPESERADLARFIKDEAAFQEVDNVFMVEKANLVTYKGPTMIATTLHGAAILLKKAKEWDWFINLSASDYPLVSQDDLLHVFSYLPKDLNFIEHTSDIAPWRQKQRVEPILVDPGLYQDKKTDIYWMAQRRPVPTKFRLYIGSAWVVLTRSFMEWCNGGWDNLPRTLLMYYSNFVSSPEGYFHTVLCNSEDFRNTTVNHDLHYIAWDNPPKQHPLALTMAFFDNMTMSGAAFARKFGKDDPVLDRIDMEILKREKGKLTPGGWCVGSENDPCGVRGDYSLLRPGPGARRLEELVVRLLSPETFRSQQCKAI